MPGSNPFENFANPLSTPSPFRDAIARAYRVAEPGAVAPLIKAATLAEDDRRAIAKLASRLVEKLRAEGNSRGIEGLVAEYSRSSDEGVALMCLAEALLRIPDNASRDALIRDKIAGGNWRSHIGADRSLFVNAATWGLVASRTFVTPVSQDSLGTSLTSAIKRAGEPVIRASVNLAMRMMGEQFVTGEVIGEALERARKQEAKGFAYSYDMLGEAAMTMRDADAYFSDYENAIHAIGKAAKGRGVYAGPGISIKLSALHPRYERAHVGRVFAELVPKVRALACLAKQYDIGLNIDAEEADRLELSLDVLESLALDPGLSGWDGLGFVVQAYGKRCPAVIDWIVDLAQRSGHRIMVRLVKGAYWDSEIKRAQTDGLPDFPVFTRKIHTDLCYIACARKLLSARTHVFPQFATHNAQTLATIYQLAGPDFAMGDYEFQCLHGMGEALYEEVVDPAKLARPCRIYAPVGTHETLLAYLVRRLLENGANSSFVSQIWDEDIAIGELVRDPVDEAIAVQPVGAPHSLIKLPAALYPDRKNSRGLDLSDEGVLARLGDAMAASAEVNWRADSLIPGASNDGKMSRVLNPAAHADIVGQVRHATTNNAALAVRNAEQAFADWSTVPVAERADCLDRAADSLEARMEELLGLIIREAGKSAANAIGEVREAVDFLRYYAQQARSGSLEEAEPLGPIVCISPWNFPLAIFVGQVAAALVTGNTVVAKPAEETPLIAAQMVGILHESGVPKSALQLALGSGDIGAALVAAEGICGVIFTGSTEVAKLIQRQLATRTLSNGAPIPLIAETGGQNAMIVDSSALPEQVVADVLASAFDSAGQRCSALRILCVQDDIADYVLAMLKGALIELRIGSAVQLANDIGPVISAQAQATVQEHIERMRNAGCHIEQIALDPGTQAGTFVPPTIIEIDNLAQLGREVFGPVLHVLRLKRPKLDNVLRQIRETGYGLTFGIHSRIEETIEHVTAQAEVGNIYINRNIIGAIVGVQPFGGRGLSGTGPKAGGMLYLGRLVRGFRCDEAVVGTQHELPGPVGERNLYALHPRGRILALPATPGGLQQQLDAIAATGNIAVVSKEAAGLAQELAPELCSAIEWADDWREALPAAHILIESSDLDITPILAVVAGHDGPIPIVQLGDQKHDYRRDWMLEEVSTSIDTTAAGGNASLMALV